MPELRTRALEQQAHRQCRDTQAGGAATNLHMREPGKQRPATDRLALHGGQPVRANLLPYGRQSVDEADIAAVVAALRSDWLTTGPRVGEFEEAFAARVGARFAV